MIARWLLAILEQLMPSKIKIDDETCVLGGLSLKGELVGFNGLILDLQQALLMSFKRIILPPQIVALECDKDHTHMFLNALPSLSPANMMAKIKGVTSKKCVKNFRIFGTWQVCGHAHTSFLLQEMYQVK